MADDLEATRHELGQAADNMNGLVPMKSFDPPPREPPPFPLATYLFLKRLEVS
jgi:hypothetical protein